MEDPISNPEAIAEAKRIANAPEAAQLKALLQQQNAKGLRRAMEQAAQGTYPGLETPSTPFSPPQRRKSCWSN